MLVIISVKVIDGIFFSMLVIISMKVIDGIFFRMLVIIPVKVIDSISFRMLVITPIKVIDSFLLSYVGHYPSKGNRQSPSSPVLLISLCPSQYMFIVVAFVAASQAFRWLYS